MSKHFVTTGFVDYGKRIFTAASNDRGPLFAIEDEFEASVGEIDGHENAMDRATAHSTSTAQMRRRPMP